MISAGRRKLGRTGFALAAVVALSELKARAAPNLEAAPSQVVVVSPPRCEEDSFPLVSFLDSLRVELAGRGLQCCTLAEPGDGLVIEASLHVAVAELGPCGTEPERVRITVQQRAGVSRTLEREISLTDVAQAARPRALALAVAELIRSLGEDTSDSPKVPTSVPQQPHPSPQPLTLVPASPPAFSLHIEAEARSFPMRSTNLWGGRTRFTVHRQRFHADVDLGANYSHVQTDLGKLLLRSASVGFGFGPRFASASTTIDIGPHAEVGSAWIHGTTTLADVGTASGSGAIASLGFRASIEAPAEMKLKPCLTFESGGVLRTLNGTVDGQTVSAIGGFYFLAALGVAVSL